MQIYSDFLYFILYNNIPYCHLGKIQINLQDTSFHQTVTLWRHEVADIFSENLRMFHEVQRWIFQQYGTTSFQPIWSYLDPLQQINSWQNVNKQLPSKCKQTCNKADTIINDLLNLFDYFWMSISIPTSRNCSWFIWNLKKSPNKFALKSGIE